MHITLVTKGQYDTNIGARTYVMDSDARYKMYKLKNREFVFTVDVSTLVCGINGALYFVSMDADGGLSKYPGNKAGAAYGTGYCDAQCPDDDKCVCLFTVQRTGKRPLIHSPFTHPFFPQIHQWRSEHHRLGA